MTADQRPWDKSHVKRTETATMTNSDTPKSQLPLSKERCDFFVDHSSQAGLDVVVGLALQASIACEFEQRIKQLERDLSAANERIANLEAVERMRDEELAVVRERAGNESIRADTANEKLVALDRAACYIELHELAKEIITAWDSGVVVRMRPYIKSIRKVLEEND